MIYDEPVVEQSLSHAYGLCERSAPGLWAEPLNLLSSLMFIFVAVALFRFAKKQTELHGKWKVDVYVLIFLVGCIGVASLTFHAYPTYYTELADISFIVLFINLYFIGAMLRIVKCGRSQTLICFLAYAGSTHILVQRFYRLSHHHDCVDRAGVLPQSQTPPIGKDVPDCFAGGGGFSVHALH
jgi:membrane-associated HD superfamily phosphohydrolase